MKNDETTPTTTNEIAAEAVATASAAKERSRKAPKLVPGKLYYLDPEQITVIGLDTVHRSRSEHKLWDERAQLPLKPEKVRTMFAVGRNVDPITVNEDGEVVKGRQRTKYAREVNRLIHEGGKLVLSDGTTVIEFDKAMDQIKLPAQVVSTKETSLSEQRDLAFSENAAVEPEDAITQAQKIQDYIIGDGTKENPEHTQEEAGVVFGMSVGTINGRLSLLQLTPEARAAFVNRELGYVEAVKTSKLEPEQQVNVVQNARQRRSATGGAKPKKSGKGTKALLHTGIKRWLKSASVSGTARTVIEWFLHEGDVTNEALAEVLGVRLPGAKKDEAKPAKKGGKKASKKKGAAA